MSGRYALIEMVFVYGTVLAFAVRELRKTRGDRRREPPREDGR